MRGGSTAISRAPCVYAWPGPDYSLYVRTYVSHCGSGTGALITQTPGNAGADGGLCS